MPSAHLFLRSLATVLCVAAVTTVVFRRLRLPVVTGYILAGLIIGPHVPLPLVADEAVVEMLSQLGVILLMFSIGLELELRSLARLGTTGGLVAILEVGALFSLGWLAGRMFGWSGQASLFTGAVVSISSTTVVAKSFSEQPVGPEVRELVFGVLIIEDLIAILLLATLTMISGGNTATAAQLGMATLRLLAFLAGLLLVGLFVVPRLVRAVVKLDRPETTVITAVGLCFASALLAERFGYSVALGAFTAGLCVAASGQAKKVAHLVEPIRDVFVAIFFVAVGLQIEPRMLVTHWAPIVTLVVVVLVGKTVFVALGSFLVGAGVRPAVQAGLSLAQIGEFSFIIAALGVSAKVADRSLYPIAVAIATVTAFLTPWLIRASAPLAKLIDRKLPRRIQTFAALHGSWIERLRADAGTTRSRATRLGRLLFLDGLCLLGTIVATSLWWQDVGELLAQMTSMPAPRAAYFVLGGGVALGLPLLLGVVRLSRDLGVTLALAALPAPAEGRVDLSAAPRRLLVLTLQITCMLAVCVPLVAITQPFLPPLYGMLALLVVLLVAAVFFWRSAANLHGHVRAGAEAIASVLGSSAEPTMEHDAPLELLPGLGAPARVRLTAGSAAIGRTLGEINLRGITGATVLAIHRTGGDLTIPTAKEGLREDDVLALAGTQAAIADARRLLVGDEPAVSASATPS